MSEDIKTPDSQVDVDEMKKADAEQDNLDQVEVIEATVSDAARPEGAVLEDDLAEANDSHDDDERTDNASGPTGEKHADDKSEPAGEEADTDEQIEPGKEDGQHDSTPLALDRVPVLDDVSTTASDTENIPRFLTRDQYEQVGDDPDPLPSGFEVIDGGISATGGAQTPTVPDEESAPKEALPAKPEDGAAQAVAKAGAAIADAAASVGTMLSQGMGAVREVSAARRAHSEARDHLDELSQIIEENEDELTHRRDVEANYAQIVAQQSARQASCLESVRAAVAAQQAIAKTIDDLKQSLSAMKDADKATEKRLKSALDAAESQEASAREGANRLVRRVTDAQRGLESAKADRETNLAAARKAVESAQARLNALREEFAEIQRNPSANSAAYSVRGTELENDISDAAEQLRTAQEQLPRLTAELDQSIADAEAVVAEANKPIEEARSSFRDVSNATAEARDALDAARKDAETRQKELRSQINEQEKALKNQQKAQQEAQADADNAAEILADATNMPARTGNHSAARRPYRLGWLSSTRPSRCSKSNRLPQPRRMFASKRARRALSSWALWQRSSWRSRPLIVCWTTFMK